jgi:hypothetical protein
MALNNANYKIISLSAGTNGPYGTTGTTVVHEVMCLTAGSVTLTAIGGGNCTVALTAGQRVPLLCSGIVVASGTFCAFGPNNGGKLNVIR